MADTYRTVAGSWTALVELAGRSETTPADLAAQLPDLADAERAAAVALRELSLGARQSA